MTEKQYDFIIVGAGASGLSLACHLIRSSLRGRSILIIDRESKDDNDRTWAFWSNVPTPFDDIVSRTWDAMQFAGKDGVHEIPLGEYRYKVIRGIDFYEATHRELLTCPDVEFLQGVVDKIQDSADGAVVWVGTRRLVGRWVFDSRFRQASLGLRALPARYHTLQQHFRGWEIETERPAFDPGTVTLMDFRTPQKTIMRFFYVLPFTETRALVEYVSLRRDDSTSRLKHYLEHVQGIKAYRIVAQEGGVIPMTDRPFSRRVGRHIMNIGTAGGRVKPTTGYAFMRIQRDSDAIVESLVRHGHPFHIPEDSERYRLFDEIMLDVMAEHAAEIGPIFARLFSRNPIRRILRFLDEKASFLENVRLIVTLPPLLFLRALFKLKVLGRVAERSPESAVATGTMTATMAKVTVTAPAIPSPAPTGSHAR